MAPVVDAGGSANAYRHAHWAALLILTTLILAAAYLRPPLPGASHITVLLAFRQDLPIAPLFLLLFAWSMRPLDSNARPAPRWMGHRWLPLAVIAVLLLVSRVGSDLVMHGYDLSRDEQMANFDSAIFASGRLLERFPEGWRPFADALNLRFILPIGDREYWVSAYLPVHAAFRALVGQFGDPALSSPLLTAAGSYFLWRIARLLWPDSRSAPAAALLLYLGSSQVLVTGMTSFAMSMHLTLNLLWLWLFLLRRPAGHAGAVLVGLLATGIHQPLFHPLFVLPFLGMLLAERNWRLLGFYLGAYGLIAAFWLAWPMWMSAHGSVPPVPIGQTSGIGYVERLTATLAAFDATALWMMAANLLRLVCWQHPLLLPFALFGLVCSWRGTPLVRALTVGFLLPVLVMAAILPWQGHGWGYRYVHPVLGNAILLACFGWRRLEADGLAPARRLVAATGLSLLLLFPQQASMASAVARPFAALRSELGSAPADMVIVDAATVPHGEDVVLNPPDLGKRPVLLLAQYLRPEDLPALCRRGTVALFPAQRLAAISTLFELPPPAGPTPHFQQLERALRASGCTVNDF